MSYQASDCTINFKIPNGGCSTPDVTNEMIKQDQEVAKKAVYLAKAVKNAMAEKDDEFLNTQNAPKKTCAAKGAKIALIAGLAGRAAGLGVLAKTFGKEEFIPFMKEAIKYVGGKGKFAALLASALGIEMLIGAGIGKIVEIVKAKKENKE